MKQNLNLSVIFPSNGWKLLLEKVYQSNDEILAIARICHSQTTSNLCTIRGFAASIYTTSNIELPVKYFVLTNLENKYPSANKKINYIAVKAVEEITELNDEKKVELSINPSSDPGISLFFACETKVIDELYLFENNPEASALSSLCK